VHRIDTVSVLLQCCQGAVRVLSGCCQGAVRVLSRCQKFQVRGMLKAKKAKRTNLVGCITIRNQDRGSMLDLKGS